MMDLRLRASPRHGGHSAFKIKSLIRRGGVPSGAAALITPDKGSITDEKYNFVEKIKKT